ncbi:MAG: ArsR/SmtB family transcription factor [Halanaerobiales bacterium]
MEVLEIFKALAHENRLRILNLLWEQSLCVCELKNILDINQSNASRHLRKLKQARIVEDERNGQWVYYKINQKQVQKHSFLKKIILEELKDNAELEKDRRNLYKYQKSEVTCETLDETNIF